MDHAHDEFSEISYIIIVILCIKRQHDVEAAFPGSFEVELFTCGSEDIFHYFCYKYQVVKISLIGIKIEDEIVGVFKARNTGVPWVELDASEICKVE